MRILSARGHSFCAAVRRPPTPAFGDSVEFRLADARNKADLRSAINDFDAVVNVIGGGTLKKNDVASTTSAVAVAASEEAGVRRYFAMSAGMVALDWVLFKYVLRPLIFRHILAEHRRVEEIVRRSGLAWTIVRPTALTNRSPTGYVASLELQTRALLRGLMSPPLLPTSLRRMDTSHRQSSSHHAVNRKCESSPM